MKIVTNPNLKRIHVPTSHFMNFLVLVFESFFVTIFMSIFVNIFVRILKCI